MQNLMPIVAIALIVEAALVIALLYALYTKVCRLLETTNGISEAITAPGHTGLPWTESQDENGNLSVKAPKAADHESLYDMTRYAMCALRFQLEAEQRERDRQNGSNTARLRLAFRDDDAEGGAQGDEQRRVALAS